MFHSGSDMERLRRKGETLRFGRFEIRPAERLLLADGEPVALGARAFDVLMALIERRDRVVAKDELLDVVWPGVVVEEANVQVQVSHLRKRLGRRVVATIPGRGYRFAMSLHDGAGTTPASVGGTPAHAAGGPGISLSESTDTPVGRAAEGARLVALATGKRLAAVLGAGVIGKTRIVKAVTHVLVDEHADGVLWVEVAKLPEEAAKSGSASAATVRQEPGAGDATMTPGPALSGRRTLLLVLDDREHPVGGVELVLAQAIVDAAPATGSPAMLLARLHVPDEQA
jgi:DNA-binding winged helix-turn-helix (wHTH) protein